GVRLPGPCPRLWYRRPSCRTDLKSVLCVEESRVEVIRRPGGKIMSLTNVWNRMMRRPAAPRRQKAHRTSASPKRWFPPRLEVLEDRTVLSTLTVTSPADSGDGSLRAIIAAAQSGDQIDFDQSLQGQTITLTSGQLAIS